VPIYSDPFSSVVPEVPLKSAPLVRVIAQVRFPLFASFAKLEAVGPFQEAIRAKYPILRPEQSQSILVGPQGVEFQAGPATVWRFSDLKNEWRVSLSTEAVSIETGRYTGRDEFLARLKEVLTALESSASPAVYDRLGIRYVNRVTGQHLSSLPSLVRPEILGVAGTKFGATLVHSLSESSFTTGQGRLNVRWGTLPSGATPDPAVISPVKEASWLLDLDMFTVAQQDFDVEGVVAKARSFSSTIYAFFRWSVEDEFLRSFGGTP
jgi:uncharacterized protein (TIGR04255 family)